MRKLVYEVEFLSDIVLPATSNTEGNIQQLDFVAGSNFLGMVALKYSEFEDSFKVFHSGAVRFGDATIVCDDKPTYKMPLSYFYDKGKEDKLYNHHNIDDFTQFSQLKQKRNGYITDDGKLLYIEYNYSQKSAYDKDKRTSLDGSMFGYSAIRSGSKWRFSIKIDDCISTKDTELIRSSIVGKKRLGKSKSAQYGLVEIKEILNQVQNETENSNIDTEFITLYFKSRVALVDENGNPTYDLKYLCDGLEGINIDYPKCQLKTSTFTPYNGAMQTKTYERIVINSGSVVVLKNLSEERLDEIKKGAGVYLSEGFGEVLINPGFLSAYSLTLESVNNKKKEGKQSITKPLAQFLKNREDTNKAKLDILNEVDKFITDNRPLYKNIKPSQWGKIRSICSSGKDDFKAEIEVYISNGTKKWEQKQIDMLLEKCDNLEFVKLLSIQAPKQTSKKEQSNEN